MVRSRRFRSTRLSDDPKRDPTAEAEATQPIRWPPPGLERLQGDLVRVAERAALGGGLLVLPLLFVTARELDFATLGPFADAWWVTSILAVVGLAFAADALMRTVRLLRRVAKALERGYELATIRSVLADGSRDMGFLLTGARHFSRLDEREREAIAAIRVFSVLMYALAGIWLPNALGVGLLLGAWGVASPRTLWVATLLPSGVMYLWGTVANVVAESRVRRVRRSWFRQPWADDLTSDDAGSWRSDYSKRGGIEPEGAAPPRSSGLMRVAAVLLATLAVFVAVPILTLVPTSAIGPILAQLAVPRFDSVRERAGRAEALRGYRLAADGDVTAAEAGVLLHELASVGSAQDPPPGVRGPTRRIDQPWIPQPVDSNPTEIDPYLWSDALMSAVATGANDVQRTYLAAIAAHPARADFTRLARAAAIDVASARYETPLPPEVTLATMPIPRLVEIRVAAHALVGAAAYEMIEGDLDAAEETLREIVSLGFLLADGGPTLMDNLVGLSLVEEGSRALGAFYAASGQSAEADELAALLGVADGALSRVGGSVPDGAEAWVRSLPDMVTDTTLARGLRWEYFIGVTTLTPCINLHRMVFGPDDEYLAFVERARASLVRWPSEEQLFQLARFGWFGERTSSSVVGRVLGFSMHGGAGSCGDILRNFDSAGQLF